MPNEPGKPMVIKGVAGMMELLARRTIPHIGIHTAMIMDIKNVLRDVIMALIPIFLKEGDLRTMTGEKEPEPIKDPVEIFYGFLKKLVRLYKDKEKSTGIYLGKSEVFEVTQDFINSCADLFRDHQWIHVDVAKAKETPWRGTVAHGFGILAMLPFFLSQIVEFTDVPFGMNYGLNSLRFPVPCKSGSKVTAEARLFSSEEKKGGAMDGTIAIMEVVITAEGEKKPCLVAEFLVFLG